MLSTLGLADIPASPSMLPPGSAGSWLRARSGDRTAANRHPSNDARRVAGLLHESREACWRSDREAAGVAGPLSTVAIGGTGWGELGKFRDVSAVSAQTPHHFQLEALAERFGSTMSGLQRSFESERRAVERRFQQLDRQLQSIQALRETDRGRDGDWRERWAELQGSVSGLTEESQALARRVEGVDERIWARANAAEDLARQNARELGQQNQGIERQHRLGAAAAEEAQKRQVAKQRHVDHALEDWGWRISKLEEVTEKQELQTSNSALEGMIQAAERRLNQELHTVICADAEAVQGRLEAVEIRVSEAAAAVAAARTQHAPADGQGAVELRRVTQGLEDRLTGHERRINSQLEELSAGQAALRVKVDTQRQGVSAERLESAFAPTAEALRNELQEERAHTLREVEGRLAELTQRVDLGVDSEDITQRIDRLSEQVASNGSASDTLRREMKELRGAGTKASQAPSDLQALLPQLADQLEVLDEVTGRVRSLERWRNDFIEDKRCRLAGRGRPMLDDSVGVASENCASGLPPSPQVRDVQVHRSDEPSHRNVLSTSGAGRLSPVAEGISGSDIDRSPLRSHTDTSTFENSTLQLSAGSSGTARERASSVTSSSAMSCMPVLNGDDFSVAGSDDLEAGCDDVMSVEPVVGNGSESKQSRNSSGEAPPNSSQACAIPPTWGDSLDLALKPRGTLDGLRSSSPSLGSAATRNLKPLELSTGHQNDLGSHDGSRRSEDYADSAFDEDDESLAEDEELI